MNPKDKENVKNILDMFGERYSREFIQKVYLMNNRQFELTLDMFLTENLPEQDEKLQLTIIETAPQSEANSSASKTLINTNQTQYGSQAARGGGNQVDMRSYVLDQYKEVLFPQH